MKIFSKQDHGRSANNSLVNSQDVAFKAKHFPSKKNALIIGAGVVGTVYGRHLALGGFEVAFWVKDESKLSLIQSNLGVYPLNCLGGRRYPWKKLDFPLANVNCKPLPWPEEPPVFYTNLDQIQSKKWDYLILCVPSNEIRTKKFQDLLRAMQGNGIWVSFSVGLRDQDYLRKQLNKGYCSGKPLGIIFGVVPFLGYVAPLPPEEICPPGIAYWFPPGSVGWFNRSGSELGALVEALKSSGFPVRLVDEVEKKVAVPTAFLSIFSLGLEASNWDLKAYIHSPLLKESLLAFTELRDLLSQRQALLESRNLKSKKTLNRLLCVGMVVCIKNLYRLSRWLCPFNLGAYLKTHFKKIKEQTQLFVGDYGLLSREFQLELVYLNKILQRVEARRAAGEGFTVLRSRSS